jgi:hypothetical protein
MILHLKQSPFAKVHLIWPAMIGETLLLYMFATYSLLAFVHVRMSVFGFRFGFFWRFSSLFLFLFGSLLTQFTPGLTRGLL